MAQVAFHLFADRHDHVQVLERNPRPAFDDASRLTGLVDRRLHRRGEPRASGASLLSRPFKPLPRLSARVSAGRRWTVASAFNAHQPPSPVRARASKRQAHLALCAAVHRRPVSSALDIYEAPLQAGTRATAKKEDEHVAVVVEPRGRARGLLGAIASASGELWARRRGSGSRDRPPNAARRNEPIFAGATSRFRCKFPNADDVGTAACGGCGAVLGGQKVVVDSIEIAVDPNTHTALASCT